MIADQLPALLIVIPMLAAPVCVLLRHALACWVIAFLANCLTVATAWSLFWQVRTDGVIRYALGGWAAPTGIEYYVDMMNATMLLLVSFISSVVLVFAYKSVFKTVPVRKHYLFYAAWMLCLTGLLGMCVTGDAFNVFVFLEISSLSMYMLIAFGSDKRALTASFRYLIMGSIGASFILIGIGFLYAATGALNMVDLSERIPDAESQRAVLVAFSFMTIGLMIKSAVFPLHGWLANAYQHSPIAVTAFLAGTATKVSLYVLLRFFFSIFGTEYSFGSMLLNVVLLPAAVTAFILLSLVAIYQTDLRRMLAYSSVAQIGYIIAAFSLATQAGLTAGIVHIINHGIIKTALFMSVGCILYQVGHTHSNSLDNLFQKMPLTVTAFILSGLGLIGVPLTVGFVSKFSLISASMERGWWMVGALVLVSSLFAIIYIGRVIEIMLFRKARESEPAPAGRSEAPLMMLVPLYVLIAVSIWFGVSGDTTLSVASEAAAALLGGLPMNPLWALLPPLLVIPFIILFGEKHRNLREASIVIAGIALLAINNRIYSAVMAGDSVESGELALLSNFSLRLSAEPIGVMFGLLASFLWIVTTVYSVGYMRGHNEKNQTRFYCCFALAIACVMGAAYAGNLLTLFVAYEAITLSTFPLVTHAGNDASRRAGRLYLLLLMCGSIGLFLPAVIWIATAAGTLDFLPGGILADAGLSKASIGVLLALCVFGVGKAAVMPFHRWLPAAMVAPTPVSALLHAVAVVKTGVFTILKVITYIFGIDMISTSGVASYVLPVVAFTIIASSLIAFTKDNLKARLAYSTISQLSYIVMAALLATTMSVTGGALHIVMHAFGKITLFFCAGAIMVASHKKNISELDGLGKKMPITMICFFIGALSIIGLPPAGGVWSKLLIAGGSLDAENAIWIGVLMLSTLLNIAYLLPIPLRAFFKPAKETQTAGWSEAPFPSLWAITLTSTACILLFVFPQPLIQLLSLIEWR